VVLNHKGARTDCANNGLESVNQYERSYSSASAVANNPDVDDAFSIAVDSPGSLII